MRFASLLHRNSDVSKHERKINVVEIDAGMRLASNSRTSHPTRVLPDQTDSSTQTLSSWAAASRRSNEQNQVGTHVNITTKRRCHYLVEAACHMVLEKAHANGASNPFIVQTSTTSLLISTAVLTHSSSCGSISLNLVSSRQRLVMKCLPVQRADISGNCIWGANPAALTTWPFNPCVTLCVCWEHLSPQSSLQPQKKWAHAFSDGTRRGGTIFTSKADCQASRAHVQTTDHNSHEHEWRLSIVSPEPKKNTHQRLITSTYRRQTWCAEEQTTRRTVTQHDTCTQGASIFLKQQPGAKR